MNMPQGKEKSPRSATNTSGLGMVNRGLPNHLRSQRLGEDGCELYQFTERGHSQNLSTLRKRGVYAQLKPEDSLCPPLPPPTLWSVGDGDSALAVAPRPNVPVRLRRLVAGSTSSRHLGAEYG